MNVIFALLILLFAIAVVETDDFFLVPIFLILLQSAFITELYFEGSGLETLLPLILVSLIIIPAMLYLVTAKTKRAEEEAILHGLTSVATLSILVIITYVILGTIGFFHLFTLEMANIQWLLIIIGVYGVLVKTDLRKAVACLTILTGTLHLFTSGFDLMMDIALLTFSTLLLLMLLYFAYRSYITNGSMSTKDLTTLRQ
ncbi:MAG: hypothetical protein ACFFCO_06925 [Promethearchaeota archaeon]